LGHSGKEPERGACACRAFRAGSAGRIGGKIARLLGADSDEVIVADSTSVNLFKLALTAVRTQAPRHKIITDDLNFPSDVYILQGVCKLLGPEYHLEIVPSADGIHGPLNAISNALDAETALLSLSHSVFKSGYTYPMADVTAAAHAAGALTQWDLSHSAGALPVELNATGADFAVGCTYKYLNGGPGAPAFLFVRKAPRWAIFSSLAGGYLPSVILWAVSANSGRLFSYQQTALCVLLGGIFGYLISLPFWSRISPEERAATEAFYEKMKKPVDFEGEVGGRNDSFQLIMIGRFAMLLGVLFLLLLIPVDSAVGRWVVLTISGIITGLGLLMWLAGKHILKKENA